MLQLIKDDYPNNLKNDSDQEDEEAITLSFNRQRSGASAKMLTILHGSSSQENMVIKKQPKFEFKPKPQRLHSHVDKLKAINKKLTKQREKKEALIFNESKGVAPDDDQLDTEFWASCRAEDIQEDLLNPES